ncbi:hypothetical protein LAZ67_1004617 [Cordylochernes scorpioides]|uniref:Uncharacterized protein n=1 Tax=Cordylochernes scorpioides TaxID=51811 RepID=A0ABY6JXX4_9ARAC|nr:hypothetical protein LAZ67_1004617 [Cordylochernes scorpioides]
MPSSASPGTSGSAGQEPGRPSIPSPTGVKKSNKNEIQKIILRENSENRIHANPPAGVKDVNLAAARDVTLDLPAGTSSNGAARALRNWADCPEDQGPGADDDFTVVRTKKRRRESANSPTAAAPSSNIGSARTSRRPQSSAGSVPRAQEVRTTRAHITEARARQASSSEDHCIYLEHGPELQPFHYLRALDRMLGGTAGVIQVSKVNGHQLLGLANRDLAERLINEGLEVEGTLLRAFPFRKRAERITVGNLPFFVEDSAIISALKPYGRVTSIAPKLMKAGPYTYNDGRREAFIVLREGMTTERLPTRLEIPIKGEAWPAYLSSGIKCSRCHGQGHRRANCPLLAGRANNYRLAPPTSPAGVPSTTTSAPPQRSAAQPPAPAPSSTAMEIPGASHAARAVTPSAAPRPSTPVASAVPMEMAPPAPPPVAPAPSLRAPGSHGPAVPTLDVEMSIEETSTSRAALKTSPAAVPPTPPLPAPQPAGPIPPAPDEEEMTPTMREECMVIEILKKLKHLTCLGPLYQSGIQPNDLKDAILFFDERESLMARLTPAMRGVLAEFLSAAIEPARGKHPDTSSRGGLLSERSDSDFCGLRCPRCRVDFRVCALGDVFVHGDIYDVWRKISGNTVVPISRRYVRVRQSYPNLFKGYTLRCGDFTMEQKLKQRICIEICVKLQISATETFKMHNKAFPNDPQKEQLFLNDILDLKLAEFLLKMILGKNAQNVQKITDLIKENPRTTLLEIEQDTGISKTTIGRIVTKDLKLKKTPSKFIPRFLTNEQKLCRLATCENMLEMTRTDPEWKDKIITGDETWGSDSKKRPEKWTNGDWILHQDNARHHTAHLVTSFLAKNGTVILPLPPYSPDIAPNDFFLFPKLKAVLKGRHFDTRDDIIEKSLLALKSNPKELYKTCFDNLGKRWRWYLI